MKVGKRTSVPATSTTDDTGTAEQVLLKSELTAMSVTLKGRVALFLTAELRSAEGGTWSLRILKLATLLKKSLDRKKTLTMKPIKAARRKLAKAARALSFTVEFVSAPSFVDEEFLHLLLVGP